MQITQFHIKIADNNLVFKSDEHKAMFKRWLGQWEGKEVSLEIKEKKNTRSQEQNKYLWLYYGVISDETGFTPDEVHEWAKGVCLPTEIKEMFGDKVRIKKSTTELTKGQMVEFIMNIEENTGIPAPDTTEYFGYSYHRN
jgi:hypothetical protein